MNIGILTEKTMTIKSILAGAVLAAALCGSAAAQVQTCVWPNRCAKKTIRARVAQVQPCVWPRLCRAPRVG